MSPLPRGAISNWKRRLPGNILDNIRASYGNTAGLVSRAASFTEDNGLELTLANFLDYYHLDPRAIYKFSSFSRICARADVTPDFSEPLEEIFTKALGRLAVVDSRRWIRFLLDLLPRLDDVDFSALSELEQRMLQMFYVTVWGKAAESWESDEVLDNLYALSDSPVLLGELFWICSVTGTNRLTSLMSRWIWALTARWISTALIRCVKLWQLLTIIILQHLQVSA